MSILTTCSRRAPPAASTASTLSRARSSLRLEVTFSDDLARSVDGGLAADVDGARRAGDHHPLRKCRVLRHSDRDSMPPTQRPAGMMLRPMRSPAGPLSIFVSFRRRWSSSKPRPASVTAARIIVVFDDPELRACVSHGRNLNISWGPLSGAQDMGRIEVRPRYPMLGFASHGRLIARARVAIASCDVLKGASSSRIGVVAFACAKDSGEAGRKG